MMWSCMFFQLIFSLMMIMNTNGVSSPITPFTNYSHSIELLVNTADLWWTVDFVKNEITFEYHVNTTGWIALGISPAGGMPGADIGVGGISQNMSGGSNQTGQLYFQDRYAYDHVTPVIDNTTTDWFGLQGREQDGWTAIQFKRLLDTCDSMDVPIKSGNTIVIFAWGLADPTSYVSNDGITYHGVNRGQRVIPLLSYSDLTSKEKFAGLDTFEFRVNNYTLPTDKSTYYCQIFKTPNNFPNKRHVIAREIVINSSNDALVYHLSLSECDPKAQFDDNNLPSGKCDDNVNAYSLCEFNIVIPWATGGDYLLEFPNEAGLPIGLDFPVKYYMLQINYFNVDSGSNYVDNSGIRFYVGNNSRPYDLGGLTFGVDSSPSALAIPPNVSAFSVDSYCTANASLYNIPDSGVTVFSFFGHTHSQGKTLWTKLVRNQTAVQYLFDAESYDPQYQFEYTLSQPIKIYPGDEFATRCIYNTINKVEVTLGGHFPSQEMCVQVFNYYPRMSNLYTCASKIAPESWQTLMNSTILPNDTTLSQWLLNLTWTSDLASQFQRFFNGASRYAVFGRAGYYNLSILAGSPTYNDLNSTECQTSQNNTTVTTPATTVMPTTISVYNNSNNSSTTIMINVNTTTTMPMGTTTTMPMGTTTTMPMGTTTTMSMDTTTTMPMGTTTTMPMGTTTTMSMDTTTMSMNTSATVPMGTTTAMVMNTTTMANITTTTTGDSNNLVVQQAILVLLLFISFLTNGIII